MSETEANQRYQALLQLLRTSEEIWNASRVFFGRWDLSPSQFNVLNLLVDSAEGITQIELSRLLIMHRSNATGLIDRLEARRLVERKSIPGDRRAHRVVLTPAGRQLVCEILPVYHRLAEAAWDNIPEARITQFMTDLSQLSKNVKTIESSIQ